MIFFVLVDPIELFRLSEDSTHKSISISPVSSSTTKEAVGEGVIEDEDILPLLLAGISTGCMSILGLLLGTPANEQ